MKYLIIFISGCCLLMACKNEENKDSEKFQTPPSNSGTQLEIQRVNDAIENDTTNYHAPERKAEDSVEK